LAKQQGVSEDLLDAMYHIDEHAEMFTPAERVGDRCRRIRTRIRIRVR
jgi:hypothetical protein